MDLRKPQGKLEALPWIQWAEHYLEQNPMVSVDEFEQRLIDAFKGESTPTHEQNLGGKNRKRKLNLTDHAKASLTRRGLIKYVTIGRIRSIVFVKTIGSIDGHGPIVSCAHFWKVVRAMAK